MTVQKTDLIFTLTSTSNARRMIITERHANKNCDKGFTYVSSTREHNVQHCNVYSYRSPVFLTMETFAVSVDIHRDWTVIALNKLYSLPNTS